MTEADRAVSVDTFIRAETDRYFAHALASNGGKLGVFHHGRDIASVDQQSVIRYNRDVLLSGALFDLEAGPADIFIPDPGRRFLSILVIDEDHYNPIADFGGGTYRLSRETIGTRYALVALRTFVDPNDPADLAAAHALQDAVTVDQPGGPGSFTVPKWDAASLGKVRDALLVLASTLEDYTGSFGREGEVDPIRHLIGTASGWGGNPESVAKYLNVTPDRNDGRTIYRLEVPADVPVDGFWSIAVYNAQGYFEKNDADVYNINNVTAAKNADGSVTIQFGACDRSVPNCVPIVDGWNYIVRLYRPRPELLDGSWKFPEPRPIG